MKSPTLNPLLHTLYRCCAPGSDGRSDADLLERFVQLRDQEAFAALVQRHGPMVLAVCQRLLPDCHEAEDAFQATFLILVRKSPSLRQPGQLAPWLYGVAYRTALRLRHKSARWQPAARDLDAQPGPATDPLDRLAWQEVRAILDEEIQRLPGKYRLPVVLCYLQGQSYTEAARSLGWPAGTVSVRLARARERLRQRFARRGLGLTASLLGGLLTREVLAAPLPGVLASATVHAGAAGVGGRAGLTGVVSQQVITLTEGVLQAMWTTKLKATFAVALAVGLLGMGAGGWVWQQDGQARGQAPLPARDGAGQPLRLGVVPDPNQPPALGGGFAQGDDLEALERQLQRLEQQLRAKQQQLQQLRQHALQRSPALDEIAAALKKLQQVTANSPKQRAAVDEFERAFAKLKANLKGGISAGAKNRPLQNFGGGLVPAPAPGPFAPGLVVQGKVLKVDREAKLVLLSVGSKNGVKQGEVFLVYQGGTSMPNQTGWLRVREVSPNWSIATIIRDHGPGAPIQANDIIQRNSKATPPDDNAPAAP
jgi:RNA polymerase sigma factor (sigma-70 family)